MPMEGRASSPVHSGDAQDAENDDGLTLIVGLGNPGIEYQFTPHNFGFLTIDRIADDL